MRFYLNVATHEDLHLRLNFLSEMCLKFTDLEKSLKVIVKVKVLNFHHDDINTELSFLHDVLNNSWHAIF